METAGLFVTYNVDLSSFTRKVKQAQATFEKSAERMQKVADRLSSIGQTLTMGVTAPIALAGASAISMASDMEESMNKVDVAFKDSSKQVKEFAKTSLKQFGVSQSAALDTAALFGDMGTSMGLTTSEAATMASQLTGLSGDLSSFKNIQQDVAKTALAGIFTGETESLKQLGIVMTQTNLELFAMEQGITKSMKEMTEAEKVNLRYAFVMSKTANAQGDFARTSDGFANQMRILQGTTQEVVTEIGNGLLPIATKLVNKATELVSSFRNLTTEQKKYALEATAAAAALGPLLFAVGKIVSIWPQVVTGVNAMSAAFSRLNKSLGGIAGKVLIFVSAIAGIAVVGKSIYDTYEPIRKWFNELWDSMTKRVKDAAEAMIGALSPVLSVLGVETDELLKQVTDAWDSFIDGATDKAEELKLPDLWSNIKKNFTDLVGFMGSNASALFKPLLDQLKALDSEFGKVAANMGSPSGSGGFKNLTPNIAPPAQMVLPGVDDIDFKELERRKKAMEEYRKEVEKVSFSLSNTLSNAFVDLAQGARTFSEMLRDLLNQLIRLAAQQIILGVLTGGASGFFSGMIPGFATGGLHNGGPAIVGERGPELINTGRARIFSANQTKEMLGGMGEPVQQSVNIDADISLGQPVVTMRGQDIVMIFERAKLRERDNFGKNTTYRT